MSEKILLVGGSGFFGKNLVNYKDSDNHLIYSTFNKNKPKNPKNNKINWFKLDLNSPKQYKKDILEIQPNVIIFLSWEKIPNFSKAVSKKNLLLSQNFFKFIIKKDFCKKIIVTGSCLEYKKKFGLLKENSQLDKKNYFSKAKIDLYLYLKKKKKKKKKSN